MTNQEAKLALQGYRPNGADAEDPVLVEALDLARRDPQLGAWFEKQQAFDRAMAAEYEALQPPPDLRSRILSGAPQRAATPVAPASASTIAPVIQRWWLSPTVWLSVAASIAILLAMNLASRPKPKIDVANSALAAVAIDDAQHPKTHGGKGEKCAELNRTLKLETTHLSDPLNIDFLALRDTGCRAIKVEGREVLEVCFKRIEANLPGAHCYIARQEDFPTLTAPAHPTVIDKPNASIATWQRGGLIFIVVTKPGRAALEKIL